MDAGGEGFEDWDADFLDQVIRVEERALACSASASQHPPPPQPPNPSSPSSSGHLPTLPSMPQPVPRQSRLYAPSSLSSVAAPPLPPAISYSPPRELSQRHVDYCRPSSRQPHDGHASAAPAPPSADAFENLEYERLKVRALGTLQLDSGHFDPCDMIGSIFDYFEDRPCITMFNGTEC